MPKKIEKNYRIKGVTILGHKKLTKSKESDVELKRIHTSGGGVNFGALFY